MKLNKLGGIVLAIGIVATLLWVMATPEVTFVPMTGEKLSCQQALFESICGPDAAGMMMRFVIGSVTSFALAFAASAVFTSGDKAS